MKKTTSVLTVPAAITAVLLTLGLWVPPVMAQQTISLGNLISGGLANPPSAGYSVTGAKGFTPFVLTNIYNNEAHGGSITIYKCDFAVESATVTGTNSLLVKGKLKLAELVKVPGSTNLTIASESQSLEFNKDGFARVVGGKICFAHEEGLSVGKLTFKGICAVIEPTEERFGGSAQLEWSMGPGHDPCSKSNTNMPIDVGVIIKGGKLESASLSITNLRKPLGSSGAFLDEVHGTVGGFSDDGNWYIQAGMVANAGCPIEIKDVGTNYPISVIAEGKVTAAACVELYGTGIVFGITVANTSLHYSPPFDVSAEAHVKFFPDYLIYSADCNFELQDGRFAGEARGKLQIPQQTPLVGGWQIANTYAAVDNNGFQGSFTINVSPEIKQIDIPQYCPPKITLYWYPCGWWSMCRKDWKPPCIGPFHIPGIPAVTAHVGFKFQSGAFTWDEKADDQVEAWELSYRHVITDAATGNRMWFMSNYDRRDKASTGPKGRPFTKNDDGQPVTTFTVPEGEENVIFRLTYQNTSAPRVVMGLQVPGDYLLDVNGGSLPNGYPTNVLASAELTEGSYAEVLVRPASTDTPAFGEAYFSLPKPKAGQYTVIIYNDKALGNFAVEYLRQNIAPTLALNGVQTNGNDYSVNFTSVITERAPTTRVYLCKLGDKGQTKAGPRYLVDEFPSATGTTNRPIYGNYTNVTPGLYRVGVNIDDPESLQAEAISSEEIFVDNPLVPHPVEQVVTLARNQKFDIAWLPSTSTNVVAYIVRYSKSALPTAFQYQKTVGPNTYYTTVDGLTNGQPYLVTVVAVSQEGYQSKLGPVTRVVPTEGFGLTLPAMFNPPDQIAVVGSQYLYRPRVFWADAEINQLLGSALLPTDADVYFRALVSFIETVFPNGLQSPITIPDWNLPIDPYGITNLVDALFVTLPLHWELIASPPGMTIDECGAVRWTPAATIVTNVTICASLTNLSGTDVPKLSVLQSFPLTVVAAKYKNTSGLTAQPQTLFAEPITKAFAGRIYAYVPILGPDSYSITNVEGPAGMTIKQLPDPRTAQVTFKSGIPVGNYTIAFTTINVVYWDVPANATDQRVRLRAVPKNIVNPTEADYVYQDFYLSVVASTLSMPQPIEISRMEYTTNGVGLTWAGKAGTSVIERSTDLTTWQQVGPSQGLALPTILGPLNPPVGSGKGLDPNPPPGKAFYRIVGQ